MSRDIRAALYAGADDLLDDFIRYVRQCAEDDVFLPTAFIAEYVQARLLGAIDDLGDEIGDATERAATMHACLLVVAATAVQRLTREPS